MAREVAVDVASHSPQVDPILDDLTEALEDISPMEPTVPYYSATLYDPRDPRTSTRTTGRTTCGMRSASRPPCRPPSKTVIGCSGSFRHTRCSPTRWTRTPAVSTSSGRTGGMRREQELPHGLRAFVGDLHSAGAAIDFAALWPSGALVDAPLPTWTHPRLILTRDGQGKARPRWPFTRCLARTSGCRKSPNVTCGNQTSAPRRSRGSVTTRCTASPHSRVPPTARSHSPPRARSSATASEACDIVFQQLLLLEDQTPVSAVASCTPAVSPTSR